MRLRLSKALAMLTFVTVVLLVLKLSAQTVSFCAPNTGSGHVFINEEGRAYQGILLLSPYLASDLYDKPGEVHLINRDGEITHTWTTQYPALAVIPWRNQTIFAALTPPIKTMSFPGGGTTGKIVKLGWNSDIEWEYEDSNMTHDFEVLPDEKVAYVTWLKAPERFAQKVPQGFNPSNTPDVFVNGIVLVGKDKERIWEWRMFEHIQAEAFALNARAPRHDWAHANSLRFIEKNPINGAPAFLMSARHISTVFLIEYPSGEIIWRSPTGMFSMQHDATVTETGTILVFDNGYEKQNTRPLFSSRVVEVDPKTNTIIWEFDGGKTGTERAQLATSIMGGAQRLPNGNTLITVSTSGRTLEVTKEKKIVWDYVNFFPNKDATSRIVFRSRKFSEDLFPMSPFTIQSLCKLL